MQFGDQLQEQILLYAVSPEISLQQEQSELGPTTVAMLFFLHVRSEESHGEEYTTTKGVQKRSLGKNKHHRSEDKRSWRLNWRRMYKIV